MKLLRVVASNFKNCCDNFTIDFIAKSKKTSEDKEYELQAVADELYVWGIMRIESNKADGSLQIAHCDPHMRITGCIYDVSRLHRLTTSTFTDTIILANRKRDYRK